MGDAIKNLVSMRDKEGLYELMTGEDDPLMQMDAAEGLIHLGDRRGLDFLLNAVMSTELETSAYADAIMETPEAERFQQQLADEEARLHQRRLEDARVRLRQGKKVFLHKMIYIPSGDILREDFSGGGFSVPDLTEMGLEGWEVIGFLPRRQRYIAGGLDEHIIGAYFLLKKELTPDEGSTLEGLEP